ncbi:polysaccharide deacetylase family protein [Desulfomicrobium sp. ZS1]|uniref:polysaccharide deacetylase family protein n=1 Tax=Desulfomicrobium sp. ZS1 TaxID=2952228 RepID=UPI0020B410F4|nr:polysaccharide deacetylase family protein [Desulfomicrobium sp. ZS1]UTF50114.1 polysaccharide deacetylase family protein [Desulfomicrobium sp. ZS1]
MSKTILSLTQSLLGASIPVLCYHQVRPESGMTPEKFGSHLDLIRKMGFETISLARLYDVITGKEKLTFPAIVITFDDCTLDNWVYAVPELLRRNMTGVFFAITDFLRPGQARPRADQTMQPARVPAFGDIMQQALSGNCDGFMNEGEIRAVTHDQGLEVYSHSARHQACFTRAERVGVLGENRHWSHPALCGQNSDADTAVHPVGSAYAHAGFGLDWTGRPLALATEEERLASCLNDFSAGKARLEELLGQPCPFLCLPWGEYDQVTLAAAKKAGYQGVLNLEAGHVGPKIDPMRIGRLAVKDRKTLPWLGLKALLLAHQMLAPWAQKRNADRRV